jgi:hypothetical protein
MKTKAFLIVALTVIVFACSEEPEVKDPVVGDWKHTITRPLDVNYVLGDPIYPAITTTFTITRDVNSYSITNVKTEFAGREFETEANIGDAVLGESISALTFTGEDFYINMKDIRFLEMHTGASVDSLMLKNPGKPTVYKIKGSALFKVN